MMKIVLKLDIHENKCRRKALKKASGLSGVDSVALDSKDQKLTLTGDVDPVEAVSKLRKVCHTDIVSVGPAKQPEKKKEEPKPKKEEPNKEPPKLPYIIYPQYYYPPQICTYDYPSPSDCYCGVRVVEEQPSFCVIY